MNCRRIVNLLSAYVDGELTGVEMLEIRRHLSECQDCADEYEAVRFTKLAVSRLRTVAPRQELAASIIGRLDVVSVPSYQRAINSLLRFAHWKLSPVTAALAASGFALVVLTAGGIDGINMAQNAPVEVQPVTQYQSVGLMRESYRTSSISSEPLELASYTSEPGKASFRVAGLTSR